MGSCGLANDDKSSSFTFNDGEIQSKQTGILDYIKCCDCSKKPKLGKNTSILMITKDSINNNINNNTNKAPINEKNENNDNSFSSREEGYYYPSQSFINNNNKKFKKKKNEIEKKDIIIDNKSIFIMDSEGIINSRIRYPGN